MPISSDFIRFCFGEPEEVMSTGTASHVTTIYRFGARGPAHVVAEGGQDLVAGSAFRMRYLVAFERATADWDVSRDPTLLLTQDGRSQPVVLPTPTAYEAQMRHFVELVTGRSRAPRATIQDAVCTAALLEAEEQSLKTGRPVSLDGPHRSPGTGAGPPVPSQNRPA
jgi:predicted dehydrogenase